MATLFADQAVFPDGSPVANALITVRLRGSMELATLYADIAESAGAENPVQTLDDGSFSFYATPGYYDLVYMGNEVPITVGDGGGNGGGNAGDYTHIQNVASKTWLIVHNLGFYPAGIKTIQSTGEEIIGSVEYPDINTVKVEFTALTAGVAHLS